MLVFSSYIVRLSYMWSYAWTEEKLEPVWGSSAMGSISAAATSVPPRLGVPA